jgi:hypothetical protein
MLVLLKGRIAQLIEQGRPTEATQMAERLIGRANISADGAETIRRLVAPE